MNWTDYFKVLSEPSRLRIMNLLYETELNVNELMEMMNMQQSRVSKHLKVLKDSGLVLERRDGTWRFYSMKRDTLPKEIDSILLGIWQESKYLKEKEKVKFILEKRKLFAESFLNSSHSIGLGSFYSFENLATAFALMIPSGSKVLDAGCGQGKLLWYLAHNPEIELYGIDLYKNELSKTVFKDSESQVKERIHLTKADITQTGFKDSTFDFVFANMVMHHIDDLSKAFHEVSRILKKRGKWIVIDFFKHNKETMREQYKDFWLGFTVEELDSCASKSGLKTKAHYLIPQETNGKEEFPDNLILMFEK